MVSRHIKDIIDNWLCRAKGRIELMAHPEALMHWCQNDPAHHVADARRIVRYSLSCSWPSFRFELTPIYSELSCCECHSATWLNFVRNVAPKHGLRVCATEKQLKLLPKNYDNVHCDASTVCYHCEVNIYGLAEKQVLVNEFKKMWQLLLPSLAINKLIVTYN
jgi:hypothetical protein